MIQIALFQHSRHYYKHLIQELNKLDINTRDNIILHILYSESLENIEIYNPQFKIKTTCCWNGGLTYLDKVLYATMSDCEFSIKIDDDILLLANQWKQLLSSVHLLNDKICLLTPVISNGVPTVDFFVQDLLDYEKYRQLFQETEIPINGVHPDPNYTGNEYAVLNSNKSWDYTDFYNRVSKIQLPFKGIHPVRVNETLQTIINQDILSSDSIIDNINKQSSLETVPSPGPYLCNSIFAIRTSDWKNIFNSKELFIDPFDEVPLNQFIANNHKQINILRKCYVIHPYYNVNKLRYELSNQFFNQYLKKVNNV